MAKKVFKQRKIKKIEKKRRKKKKRIKKEALDKNKFLPVSPKKIKMKVVGIGGGGGSIVSEIAQKLKRIKFLVANTDLQALKKLTRGVEKFHFGRDLTQGLGTGMKAELGKEAAQAEIEKIKKIFQNEDFSILVSSLGGGTGSGASPIFAKVSKDLKNYTLGIFTLPFLFEGQKRMEIALQSLEEIKPNLNTFIVVPNERIFQIIDQKTPMRDAFSAINKILAENLGGLIRMLFLPGVINIDFADLKTILAGKGKLGFLNTVTCQGENRAEEAAKKILENPLYEYGISGAERILFNISGSKDLAMAEVEKISRTISDFNRKAKIIFGISQVESLKNSLKITLLAIGCREKSEVIPQKRKRRKPKKLSKSSRKSSKKEKPVVKKIKVGEIKPEEPVFLPESKEEEKIEIKTRRNALEVKKDLEKAEQELLAKETQWETPAFLRKKH